MYQSSIWLSNQTFLGSLFVQCAAVVDIGSCQKRAPHDCRAVIGACVCHGPINHTCIPFHTCADILKRGSSGNGRDRRHLYDMADNQVNKGRTGSLRSLDISVDFSSPAPLPDKHDSGGSTSRTGIGALTPLKSSDMALKDPQPRCLFFDVFGTCVDWRKTVTDALWNQTREALNSPASSVASRIRMVATDMVRLGVS